MACRAQRRRRRTPAPASALVAAAMPLLTFVRARLLTGVVQWLLVGVRAGHLEEGTGASERSRRFPICNHPQALGPTCSMVFGLVRAGRTGPERSERPRRFLDSLDPERWGRLAQLRECARRGLISRALQTGANIDHGTFTAGSGPVASNAMRCDGGAATAQMDNIAAIMIVIPRKLHCSPESAS